MSTFTWSMNHVANLPTTPLRMSPAHSITLTLPFPYRAVPSLEVLSDASTLYNPHSPSPPPLQHDAPCTSSTRLHKYIRVLNRISALFNAMMSTPNPNPAVNTAPNGSTTPSSHAHRVLDSTTPASAPTVSMGTKAMDVEDKENHPPPSAKKDTAAPSTTANASENAIAVATDTARPLHFSPGLFRAPTTRGVPMQKLIEVSVGSGMCRAMIALGDGDDDVFVEKGSEDEDESEEGGEDEFEWTGTPFVVWEDVDVGMERLGFESDAGEEK